MPVIDVQVHPFDRNHSGRPWAGPSHGLESATGDEMVAAMNSVGVDGAIMVSSFSAYEYDPSYALEVYNTWPEKFRVVTPVDSTDPAIDDVVARWAATQGRARHPDPHARGAADGCRPPRSCIALSPLPPNMVCRSICFAGASSTKVFPIFGGIQIRLLSSITLGCCSLPVRRFRADVWADLPKLLALAQYPNVRMKDQRRLHDVAPTIPLRRHLGCRCCGSSIRSDWIVACGALTGRGRSAC